MSGSALDITDSPFADTPSVSGESWINELDTDKGNQIGWQQDLGGEDFVYSADIRWSSTNPELTLGGIAVADSQGTIAAMVGVNDGVSAGLGRPWAILRASGADATYAGDPEQPGAAIVRITRTGGTASITIDDGRGRYGHETEPSWAFVTYPWLWAVGLLSSLVTVVAGVSAVALYFKVTRKPSAPAPLTREEPPRPPSP